MKKTFLTFLRHATITTSCTLMFGSFAAKAQEPLPAPLTPEQIAHIKTAQVYTLCAALGNEKQEREFAAKLVDILQQNNPQTQKLSNDQIIDLSVNNIEQVKNNFAQYSVKSRDKLYQKACKGTLPTDEDFQGLLIEDLPKETQQKITNIASCSVLSQSVQRNEQAQKLNTLNVMLLVNSGVNGRNEAVHQLTQLNQNLVTEFKQMNQEQLKARYQQSCGEVQKLQQQMQQQKFYPK